jgi:hypothetical protein
MSPDGPSSGGIGNSKTNSNIRVFVRWHEQVVFAGEEVKCTITFKNVARPPESPGRSTPTSLRPASQFPPNSSRHPGADRGPRQPSPLHPGAQGRGKPNSGLAPPPSARGHRSTLSLSVPSAASRARTGSVSSWSPAPAAGTRAPHNGNGNGNGGGSGSGNGHGHKRSVSIVSIGSLSTVDDGQSSVASPKPQRPRGHARASSLQILPRGGLFNGPRSGELLGSGGRGRSADHRSNSSKDTHFPVVTPFSCLVSAREEYQRPPARHRDRA